MQNIGDILDEKYEIINILGRGGMGTVYLCRNNRLGNLWAIKEVPSEWKDKIDLLAEPNILKNLSHSCIPRIIDIFYENDNLYIVEDYIDGINLKDLVKEKGCLSSQKVKAIALQLCGILEYLHSFSPPIIYRDLKPSNIMLKDDGKIVLVDFGIARTYKEYKDTDTLLLGSKGFMAPEQLYNVQSNTQTDIYSLGATLFFLVTGKILADANNIIDLLKNTHKLDDNLFKVIIKATETLPESRFKNIGELRNVLIDDNKTLVKTKLMAVDNTIDKTVLKTRFKTDKPNKKILFLAVGFVLLLVILIAASSLLSKSSAQKLSESNSSKKADTAQFNNASKQPKDIDTITRGILYKNSPIILSDNSGKGKGKNKKESNNNFNILFNINPAASISNSEISVTTNSIELINSVSILDLNIKNSTNVDINIDLSKTFLLNGNNTSFSPNIADSSTILVSQNSNQVIKLYFNTFDFEGNSYCFKTAINYGTTNKDINLYIDIR